MSAITIRPATEGDAAGLLEIYRPVVETTAISFETVVPTEAEFAARIRKVLAGWQWLVAELEGRPVGYAYGSLHRERAAYRWSTEVTAYVHPAHYRKGIGGALYRRLFDELAQKGYCNAFAGVALPNDASVALHRGVGMQPVGVFHAIGWKFGKWHDVAWFERRLRDAPVEG